MAERPLRLRKFEHAHRLPTPQASQALGNGALPSDQPTLTFHREQTGALRRLVIQVLFITALPLPSFAQTPKGAG
jgi:hypothetical protein